MCYKRCMFGGLFCCLQHQAGLVRCKPWVTCLLCARQVVREVFCWSRNPTEVRHLAQRKEELYRALLGEHSPPVAPGVKLLLETLTKHQVRLYACFSACVARRSPVCAERGGWSCARVGAPVARQLKRGM